MKTIALILMAVALAIGSGCTTPPDWIQRTLVTVDVTGHWHAVALYTPNAGGGRPELWLDLQQEGPKVKGFAQWRAFEIGSGPRRSTSPASIEGTISGVFSFRQTDGPGKGELTVRGDEMTGEVSFSGHSVAMRLHRGESSPGPAPKQP